MPVLLSRSLIWCVIAKCRLFTGTDPIIYVSCFNCSMMAPYAFLVVGCEHDTCYKLWVKGFPTNLKCLDGACEAY